MPHSNDVIQLSKDLINIESITPNDNGCQQIIANRLQKLGFEIYREQIANVTNLWAITPGDGEIFCFLGHTDVVPAGDVTTWTHPPFTATEYQSNLFGRGSADMKSAIAAMTTAIEAVYPNSQKKRRLAMLLTSDEEGVALDGVKKMMPILKKRKQVMQYCLVGEPTSSKQTGDTIKIGRRGSLTCTITINGRQGHVAYPQLCDNPIHKALPFFNAIKNIQWDEGNQHFLPSSLQFVTIDVGNPSWNVIPQKVSARFNLRYNTEIDFDFVVQTIEALAKKYQLGNSCQLQWVHSGQPFLTNKGLLLDTVCKAINSELQIDPVLSTSGGTSDGRFVAPYGVEVIECGVCNHSIHQVDEHCSIDDILQLERVYRRVLNIMLNG